MPAICGCSVICDTWVSVNTVAEAVAIVPRRVAHAAGDGNPGRKGQAKQTNKRQEPPHESSPPRAVEPRNGLKEHVKEE